MGDSSTGIVPPGATQETLAAYEAVAAMPDLVVMDEDGTVRPAADLLAEGQAIQAQAELEARGVLAAVNCFLRSAA